MVHVLTCSSDRDRGQGPPMGGAPNSTKITPVIAVSLNLYTSCEIESWGATKNMCMSKDIWTQCTAWYVYLYVGSFIEYKITLYM